LQAYPQFQGAVTDEIQNQEDIPKPDQPITSLTWYEAAQYCRWLSEQEGIPEAQICYPPIPEIEKAKQSKEGLKLAADFLTRTGYRLPTEAEWEYACRAGAATSRSYGHSEKLLQEYGWYLRQDDFGVLPSLSAGILGLVGSTLGQGPILAASALTYGITDPLWELGVGGPGMDQTKPVEQLMPNDQTKPVGQLMPNDLGLFDMHGNASEWCHDRYSPYPAGPEDVATEDREDPGPVTVGSPRVVRGGAFNSPAPDVRSARRFATPPTHRDAAIGFRVARTCR
jgi:formylglycine-generating enzyme required for sulfatase activity